MNQTLGQNRPQVNRLLVAVISIICLITGAYLAVQHPEQAFWNGGFVRAGLLMGAFWYAAPTKGRAAAWANISPWWIIGVAALLLLIVRRPRILLPLGIALLVLGVLLPKVMGTKRKH